MHSIRFLLLSPVLFAISAVFADVEVEQKIRELDAAWEQAFLVSDRSYFEKNLHPDFVWVHNHVSSLQEGKDEILAMIDKNLKRDSQQNSSDLGSRTQHGVKVVVHEKTAVAYGFLKKVFSKGYMARNEDSPEYVTYHFMRTYSKGGDRWLLLSNHTMQVPDEE